MTTNEELFCEKCNYYTNRKSDFKKHLLSTKHFNYINEKVIKENIFNCICGKHYTTRQNLWRHKQKCNIENINKQKIDNLKKEIEGMILDVKDKDIAEYKEARDRIFQVFEKIKEGYSTDRNPNGHTRTLKGEPVTHSNVDLRDPENFNPKWSAAKIRCADLLLREYLKKCLSFEPKKAEIPTNTKSNIPGVHDQTILRK